MIKTPKRYQVDIQILGAAKTVTGSKYYLQVGDICLLIDCGVFQGLKTLREENWDDLPIDVTALDMVLLTHGHLDHVGYLPRLFEQGFRGKILGTAPTLAIAKIILEDSAKIHEEDAKRANEEGYSKHHPAKPYYTLKTAQQCMTLFSPVQDQEWIQFQEYLSIRFNAVGHILGACFIEIDINGKRFVFSGDVGRPDDYLLNPPLKPQWADVLFVESTYGDRLHDGVDITQTLQQYIHEIVHKRGALIIPSFAVERLQTLMYILWKGYVEKHLPYVPIYVDSPMGANVLALFERFKKWHTLTSKEYKAMCNHIHIVTSFKETWEVIDKPNPKIVIAGSGMVTGGRVLTYIKQYVDNPDTHILLVGYQAQGTRGRQLQEGVHELKIYGKYFPVKAKVHTLEGLSAHADQHELLDWLADIKNIPEQVFLTHGEAASCDAFRVKLQYEKKWHITIPNQGQHFSFYA